MTLPPSHPVSADACPASLRRSRRRALAALLGGGLLGSTLPLRAAPAAKGEAVRWPAVRLLDGRPLPAPWLAGQAAVVVFFSTTCPFCARHNKHVQKLAAQVSGQPLQVIGVAQDRQRADVTRYLSNNAYTFAVTMDHQPLHGAMASRRVIPLTCVIDRNGRLRDVIPGEMFEEDVLELAQWARA